MPWLQAKPGLKQDRERKAMLAIIGGTGLSRLDCFESAGQDSIVTPFADEAVSIHVYMRGLTPLAFFTRHCRARV